MRQQSAQSKTQIFIKKRSDFLKTYKGRSVRKEFFTVYYVKNRLGHARFGITVPKQVGPAVIRNKFKRWAREIFRKKAVNEIPLDLHLFVGSRQKKKEDFKKLRGKEFFQELDEVIDELFKRSAV